MTARSYADTHVHPTFLPFAGDHRPIDLWRSAPPRKGQHRWRFTTYRQSDFATLARSHHRLIWAGLYPLERGFVTPARGPWGWLAPDALIRTMTGLSPERLLHNRGPDYDYFETLQLEYDYLCAQDGIEHPIEGPDGPENWCFRIARDSTHLAQILESPREIAVALTIEGAHAFGSVHPTRTPTIEEVVGHIDTVRQRWRHPLLCVTVAHHFDNGLCGHARSIYRPFHRVLDQSPGRDAPISEMGRAVVKRLLGIDGRGQEGEARILLDLKHMSLASRLEIYHLVEDHNRAHPGDSIPLIVSHLAASGRPEPLEQIVANPRDTDRAYARTPGLFNPWTLNFADEEIRRIHASGGLMGLILEQRVLASARLLRRVRRVPETIGGAPNPDFDRAWARIVLEQIAHIVTLGQGIGESASAWDHIAIGSDYDGKINALDAFPTSASLPRLEDLLVELLVEREDRDDLLDGLAPEAAIRRIFHDNAVRFAREHLGRPARSAPATAGNRPKVPS